MIPPHTDFQPPPLPHPAPLPRVLTLLVPSGLEDATRLASRIEDRVFHASTVIFHGGGGVGGRERGDFPEAAITAIRGRFVSEWPSKTIAKTRFFTDVSWTKVHDAKGEPVLAGSLAGMRVLDTRVLE